MSFEIRINGTPFHLWKSATVQRSIDRNAGAFRFSNSTKSPLPYYPVRTGDFVEILINGTRKVAGFVDEISGTQSESSHTVEVQGRDNTADLIDSSVPAAAKVSEGPVSLKKLIETSIAAIGASIKVISKVDGLTGFDSEDLQAAAAGSTCMAYLVSFARKRQVYLVPDGAGNVVIYRPDKSNKAASPIIHKVGDKNNNVLTYGFRQAQQGRFYKYKCRSQDNFGFALFAEYFGDGANRKSEVTDSQIRASRYHEFVAEESMKDKTCEQRAAEESNIRRAAGTTYTVSVAGSAQSDGTLWDFGQYVDVNDEYAGIKGNFLIKAVEYSIDITSGTKTQLTMVPPDAYQVTAEPTAADKRSAKTGAEYQNETPKEQDTIR